ncbi:MAG TPA: restriction endonuclease subunit S, partial [Archaeoglobaceae archaeon]|nr:restriction endonuclease subunit S [Archaeoglobaceae archaeon]
MRIRIRNDAINPKFVDFFFQSPRAKYISDNTALGTTRPSINTTILKNRYVPVPPIDEQAAIAKILSDLDTKIELLQKQNETLEAIAQAIFKHWFVDFEFPNEEGRPYKSSGGEIAFNEELGKDIPKGWEVKPIKELCKSISNGGTPRRM